MKRIMCYGDSNTFGWDPIHLTRFDETQRWPKLLAKALGGGYDVVEEGLGGRTCAYFSGDEPDKNGQALLIPLLQSHQPLDFVVVMLGTNDMKASFSPTAAKIAEGMDTIVTDIQNGSLYDNGVAPRVLVVSPVLIGENINRSPLCQLFDGENGVALSKQLAPAYKGLCGKRGCGFLDAADIVQPSLKDSVHMTAQAHAELAGAVYKKVKEMIL